jgi:hypothetical protein
MVAPVLLRCDGRAFGQLGNLYAAAGARAKVAVRRAVKRKGDKARGLMARQVRDLLKIRLKDVRRRLRGQMIGPSSYAIVARGSMRLEYFNTRQTSAGVVVPGVDVDWIEGREHLPIAFQAKSGKPENQPGNAGKRRGSLGGRIVYGVGKRRRQGFRSVMGVMMPAAFMDASVQAHFNRVAGELPGELMHQLWVVGQGLDRKASTARAARLDLGRVGSDDHGG